jgi:hypothetical protein
MNEKLDVGDIFENGVMIQDGTILWGTTQVVKRLSNEGNPIYRAKWGKVDKIAEYWRTPELRQQVGERE